MDPVSAFGIFAGAIRVVQAITQTITGLSALRGKYQNADPTIRSMIGELSTIKSAISELRDWTAYNAETTSSDREYEESLAVAIDGCHAIMEVLSEKVTELVKGQADPTVLAFKARVKVLWNEELMNNLQDRLHRQVRALILLLQACQCRSSTELLELLRKLENRHIIKQVADDTATLRSTISSMASSQIDAHSITSRQLSSVGETEFDFDEALLATPPYQRQQQPPYVHLPAGQTPVGVSTEVGAGVHPGLSIGTTVSANDEEYASRNLTPSHAVSANSSLDRGHSINPNDHIDPDHGRSKSVSFGAQQLRPAPGVRRWVSSNAASTIRPSSPGGTKRDRFFSALKD